MGREWAFTTGRTRRSAEPIDVIGTLIRVVRHAARGLTKAAAW